MEKSLLSNTNKQIYIWGTGDDAKTLLRRYPLINVFVNSFIDSNKFNDSFGSRVIINPKEVDWNQPIFVIVATRKYYDEIANYLIEQGLKEGKDYIGYSSAWYQLLASFESDDVLKRMLLLQEEIKRLSRWIPDIYAKLVLKSEPVQNYVYMGNLNIRNAILQGCVDEEYKLIELRGNVFFEYDSIADFSVVFEELLLNEDYYFESSRKAPLIIDAGANVGLAIYYFKLLYPDCRIIAFEPMPRLFDVIKRNIERNKWSNVEVYPYALSGEENGSTIFYVQNSGLAGSLEKRNQEGVVSDEIQEIAVKTVRLSEYLHGTIDYLKMDIEGSETKVIEEIQDKLMFVEHIFIEFHEGRLKEHNSIADISTILEKAGFVINVSKSASSAKSSLCKPMRYVGGRLSEVVWGKQIR
ncbi:MAG: FkbM family methyltransferase [Lachnospiraceae bacterium]|nr:FkbM family methyltransferase [Lachnospiraceae bacterium]